MCSNEVYEEYINGIDINKIEYINLTNDELMKFYIENYYDSKNCTLAETYNDELGWNSPIGMYYLNFESMPGMKYILGVVENKIHKKTIVSALVYCDEYKISSNQKGFITYLSTVETNMYFRNRGLYYNLISNSIRFINPNQNILISEISDMGKNCHVYSSFIQIFRSNGFIMNISNESENIDRDSYLEHLNRTNYIRIKNRNN